jgi:hypothetical protein
MPATATESTFELATIERLQQLGYRYCHGTDLNRPTTEVVLVPEVRAYLGRRYRHLPPEALDLAKITEEIDVDYLSSGWSEPRRPGLRSVQPHLGSPARWTGRHLPPS